MFNGHALRRIPESGKNSAISSRKSKSAALLTGCGRKRATLKAAQTNSGSWRKTG